MRRPDAEHAVRALRRWGASPVTQFALSAFVVVAAVAVVGLVAIRHASRNEALRDARALTRVAGEGIVAPVVDRQVLAGQPAALSALDGAVRRRVLRPPIVRVKLWDATGRIVYSDEPRLIGERFPLDDEELEALRTSRARAVLSDLTRPENRFEAGEGPLREVYLGIRTRTGRRLLFETYQREGALAADSRRITRTVVPVILGMVVVLWLVQVPLAASLARRLRRGQEERQRLLAQAVSASEDERRRLSRDLHDGAVQDLVAVSFRLGAVQDRVTDPAPREQLADAGDQVRGVVRQLRTLLVELYPDDLHRQGLEGALSDLLCGVQGRGVTTSLDVDDDLDLDRRRAALVYRTALEALRNVGAHAGASAVSVTLRRDEGVWRLEVADDGAGFDTTALGDDRPHLGLRLLRDLAQEQGAVLTVHSTPGRGTLVRLVL